MRSRKTYEKVFPTRHLEMLKLISATENNTLTIRSGELENKYLAFHNLINESGDEKFWFWILTSKRAVSLYKKMKFEPVILNEAIAYYDLHGVQQLILKGNILLSKSEFIDRMEFDFNHNPYKFENCLFSRAKILENDGKDDFTL